ncbi:MAG: DUF2889 domain-containing protein [Devosia sp.]
MAAGMQELPSPAPRRHIHTRRVISQGFLRDDGLWDIEGELHDQKTYVYADRERGPLEPGQPMHHMRARITVNNDLEVVEAHAAMPAIPFSYCSGAIAEVAGLKGANLGSGWRRALDAAMGNTRGCTHMRELFLDIATTAFQTISAYREQHMPELGPPLGGDAQTPFFLNRCHSWARTSPVVAEYFPQFYRKP